jgi:hypothetical protein
LFSATPGEQVQRDVDEIILGGTTAVMLEAVQARLDIAGLEQATGVDGVVHGGQQRLFANSMSEGCGAIDNAMGHVEFLG